MKQSILSRWIQFLIVLVGLFFSPAYAQQTLPMPEVVGQMKGHAASVDSAAFSPDGRTLASGSNDKTVRLWDVQTGKLMRTIKGHKNTISSVKFSRDGRKLAVGTGRVELGNTITIYGMR